MRPSSLKRLRLSIGVSCEEVAKQMHLTRQTVYNMEEGKTNEAGLHHLELTLKDMKRQRDYAKDHR